MEITSSSPLYDMHSDGGAADSDNQDGENDNEEDPQARELAARVCSNGSPQAHVVAAIEDCLQLIGVRNVGQIARIQRQLIHDVLAGGSRQGVCWERVVRLPASSVLQIPQRIVQHRWPRVALLRLVDQDGLGRRTSRGGEVLKHALRQIPWCNCYQSIVLAAGEVGQACRIRRYMLLLFALARL